MARNGSGTYVLSDTIAPSTLADANELQAILDDIATALTGSVAANGETTITGALQGFDGTASLPGYSFSGDLDSGLYRIGANNVGIAVNATKRFDVSTTGATVTGDLVVTSLTTAWIVTGSAAAFVGFEAITTDAGASGPIMRLYHNSATPAASDVVGQVFFSGNDSGANKTTYVNIGAILTDTTNGSEDADFFVNRMVAGTETTGLRTSAVGGNLTGDWTISGALSAATATGAVVATQANMEAGTATNLLVPVGRQHFNPRHAKAWCQFNGTGTPAVTVGTGVSSITDNGVGDYTVNFTTAFSSVDYARVVTAGAASGATIFVGLDRNAGGVQSDPAAASFQMTTFNTSFAATDSPRVSVVAYGDFA